MPTRLTVVIAQSAVRSSRATEAEETLLTELMMTAGLDATLVGSLESIQADSTDYLCLSGFTQSLALVSTLSFEAASAQWQRLQLPGEVTMVGGSTSGKTPRVYYFPLELGTPELLSRLRQLLVDRSIQTVSVALPISKPVSTERIESKFKESPDAPAAIVETGRSAAASSGADSTPIPESEWLDLDRLIDDFDTLDL